MHNSRRLALCHYWVAIAAFLPAVVLGSEPVNLDIVIEREIPPRALFDLVIATNIFVYYDVLEQALALQNVATMLKPGGFFATSDPIAPGTLPEAFRADAVARARCLSGCQTFDDYMAALAGAGFALGTSSLGIG